MGLPCIHAYPALLSKRHLMSQAHTPTKTKFVLAQRLAAFLLLG